MCDGGWEWWAGGRWIRECARLAEWDRKLFPEMRWCTAKWAIGDSGLNRHQAVQIKKEKKSQTNINLNFRYAFFRSRSKERKLQGAKVPGCESSKERKFQGAKVPHLEFSLPGANGLGSEKSNYRLCQCILHSLLALAFRQNMRLWFSSSDNRRGLQDHHHHHHRQLWTQANASKSASLATCN